MILPALRLAEEAAIGGHIEVGIAVAIKIDEYSLKEGSVRQIDAEPGCEFFKCPVAQVVIQAAGSPPVGNVQIRPAVVVIVAPGGARVPAHCGADTRFGRHILEHEPALVTQQHVRLRPARNMHVQIAVAIEIRRSHARGFQSRPNAAGRGTVDEVAGAIILIHADHAVEAPDHHHIRIAVAVQIYECQTLAMRVSLHRYVIDPTKRGFLGERLRGQRIREQQQTDGTRLHKHLARVLEELHVPASS